LLLLIRPLCRRNVGVGRVARVDALDIANPLDRTISRRLLVADGFLGKLPVADSSNASVHIHNDEQRRNRDKERPDKANNAGGNQINVTVVLRVQARIRTRSRGPKNCPVGERSEKNQLLSSGMFTR